MKHAILPFLLLLCLALFLPAVLAEDSAPETFTSGDYQYVLLEDGTAEITKYTGSAENLVLPETLNGKTVTSIGDSAFLHSSLTTISIPDSVTSIGRGAFCLCSSLTSISIPYSVTSIGNSAFSDCSWLIKISIPDSVTAIGDSVFEGCSNLTATVGRNSYALQYCQENGINYTYPDSLDWLNN